jgi:hypothetical protein
MRYSVGYRGFKIVRDGDNQPYQIWKDDKLASPGKFWSFPDARREVDHLKYNPLVRDECEADQDY